MCKQDEQCYSTYEHSYEEHSHKSTTGMTPKSILKRAQSTPHLYDYDCNDGYQEASCEDVSTLNQSTKYGSYGGYLNKTDCFSAKPVLNRAVSYSKDYIREATPPPVVRRYVERAPTPEPDVIEKVLIRRKPQEIIERIIERPRTPPPRIINTEVHEAAPPPICKIKIVDVEHSPRHYQSNSSIGNVLVDVGFDNLNTSSKSSSAHSSTTQILQQQQQHQQIPVIHSPLIPSPQMQTPAPPTTPTINYTERVREHESNETDEYEIKIYPHVMLDQPPLRPPRPQPVIAQQAAKQHQIQYIYDNYLHRQQQEQYERNNLRLHRSQQIDDDLARYQRQQIHQHQHHHQHQHQHQHYYTPIQTFNPTLRSYVARPVTLTTSPVYYNDVAYASEQYECDEINVRPRQGGILRSIFGRKKSCS